jgi:hypothetical protein
MDKSDCTLQLDKMKPSIKNETESTRTVLAGVISGVWPLGRGIWMFQHQDARSKTPKYPAFWSPFLQDSTSSNFKIWQHAKMLKILRP